MWTDESKFERFGSKRNLEKNWKIFYFKNAKIFHFKVFFKEILGHPKLFACSVYIYVCVHKNLEFFHLKSDIGLANIEKKNTMKTIFAQCFCLFLSFLFFFFFLAFISWFFFARQFSIPFSSSISSPLVIGQLFHLEASLCNLACCQISYEIFSFGLINILDRSQPKCTQQLCNITSYRFVNTCSMTLLHSTFEWTIPSIVPLLGSISPAFSVILMMCFRKIWFQTWLNHIKVSVPQFLRWGIVDIQWFFFSV